MNRRFAVKWLVAMLSPVLSASAVAQKGNPESILDTVVVNAVFAQEMGTQKIDNEYIKRLPTANGTVSELLKNNPNVQFSNNQSSESLGEIAPENVSFHGERFYNNAWLIDGLSNNDNIHPGSENGYQTGAPDGYNAWQLPGGGTQSFWLNSDIIDSIDVYDSNVSAKYGQFTGGVINAKIKDPDLLKPSGSLSYRTTRDSWVKFKQEGESLDKFERADELYLQPQFTKHNYSFNINQPLNEKAAVMLSYNRATSKIPYMHKTMKVWENQRRLSETFLLKGIHETEGGDTFKLTAMYSPHESKYFKRNSKNGGFTNTGGGYGLNGEWTHMFDVGQVTSYLGWKKTGNHIRHAGDEWFVWWTSPTFDWTSVSTPRVKYAHIGGFGQYRTEKNTFSLKQDYVFDSIALGDSSHDISLGWGADFAKAKYRRDGQGAAYSPPRKDEKTTCLQGDNTCVTGEQYQWQKIIYPAVSTDVGNNHYAFYAEDKISLGKIEVTPGVRVDYDEYLNNIDIAPRLTASYDIFGDGNSKLFGGLNRYYADSMLSYALSDNLGRMLRYNRKSPQEPWELSRTTIGRRYGNAELKTPYSDEVNLGYRQRLGNTEWTLKWVNRHGKNQFARTYDYNEKKERWYTLNNNGRSKANTFTLTGRLLNEVDLGSTKIKADWGAMVSRSQSNFRYYEDITNQETDADKVIINNELINYGELPSMDYNTPWNAFANLNVYFPKWYLNWSNRLNYTSGYTAYTKDRVTCPDEHAACGSHNGRTALYEKVDFKDRFTVDWRFTYSIPVAKTNLDINFDVLNVFNSRIASSNSRGRLGSISYKPGRQFWLGARYSW